MEKEKNIHPLIAHAAEIEERGVMVFDNVTDMPLYDTPFITSNLVIVLNQSGWTKVETDAVEKFFELHNLASVSPNHVFCGIQASSDYRCMIIALSAAFQEEMKHRYPDIFRTNFHYIYENDFHLTDAQFAVIERTFYLLKDVCHSTSHFYKTMVGDLLEVLFLLLEEYRAQNGAKVQQYSPQAALFSQFYDALTTHYRESREVRFYAELFSLSPKYFSAIIKQHTGTNAAQWISHYVIIQAKSMLKHQQQLSVQQVAHELGFPDQASFSRYFKDRTGCTPTEYRSAE